MSTVWTTDIGQVGSISASGGGNITDNGGASITARGVCWGTATMPIIGDSHSSDGAGSGEYTSALTGLSPGTKYYVRAYATNSYGVSYGPELDFTTSWVASTFQNARVYWEMYGGVPPEGNDQHVQALNINMDVGGWAADDYAYFQVSVYGRKTIDSPNLATLYSAPIHRPTGSVMWKPVHVAVTNADPDVRCVVLKVELIEQTWTAPNGSTYLMNYSDQYMDADAPPWGIRIHEASLYCSDLVRDVRAHKVFGDILAGRGFTYSGPVATWTPDQLEFSDIPKDRWDALDDVNGMLGWNYACWDGTEVEFALPKSGTAHVIAASDPRTTWSVEESLDETYNAVRVCYGNKSGKPREVIVHGSTAALHGMMRADTLQAPESIKSLRSARRFAKRYLASHETKQVAGTVGIQGDDGVLDPLLIRPGDTVKMTGPARTLSGTHEITRVTLRPLEWAADVEFGTNSKRLDTWLERLAAGAKTIKRR